MLRDSAEYVMAWGSACVMMLRDSAECVIAWGSVCVMGVRVRDGVKCVRTPRTLVELTRLELLACSGPTEAGAPAPSAGQQLRVRRRYTPSAAR
jgi:hypothetical protein